MSRATGLEVEEVIRTLARVNDGRRELSANNLCFLLDYAMCGELVQESPAPIELLKRSVWQGSDRLSGVGTISEITGREPTGLLTFGTFHEEEQSGRALSEFGKRVLRVGARDGDISATRQVHRTKEAAREPEEERLRKLFATLSLARTAYGVL